MIFEITYSIYSRMTTYVTYVYMYLKHDSDVLVVPSYPKRQVQQFYKYPKP